MTRIQSVSSTRPQQVDCSWSVSLFARGDGSPRTKVAPRDVMVTSEVRHQGPEAMECGIAGEKGLA